jgi:CheY-like chemotaxis protein
MPHARRAADSAMADPVPTLYETSHAEHNWLTDPASTLFQGRGTEPCKPKGDTMFDVTSTDVLVVDDDEAMRNLLGLGLQMLGHQTYTAASVQEAIAALETKHVDAVVSDRSMAGGSGLDLLAYVRARWPDLPFILASGTVDQELEALAYGAGADWVYDKYDLPEALPELFPSVRARVSA